MVNAVDVVPLSEFTRRPSEFLKKVSAHGRPVVITHNGRPVIVIQEVAAYDELIAGTKALIRQSAASRCEADPVIHELLKRLTKSL